MKILLLILLALAFLGAQYVIIDKLMSRAAKKPKDYIEDEDEAETEDFKSDKDSK